MQTLLLPDRICLTGSSLQICFLLSVMPGFNPSTNQSIAVEQTFSDTMQIFFFPLARWAGEAFVVPDFSISGSWYVQQTDCISCCCCGIHHHHCRRRRSHIYTFTHMLAPRSLFDDAQFLSQESKKRPTAAAAASSKLKKYSVP